MSDGTNWELYPLRECRSRHECLLCGGPIRPGRHYFDGGHGRRVHEECAVDDREMRLFESLDGGDDD